MNDYINNNELFKDDLLCRSEQVRNEIENIYNLPKQVDLEIDVFPSGAGKIKVNSITPSNYPWEGIYFDGIPVTLTAVANPGYIFSNWSENEIISNVLNPIVNDTLTFNVNSLTAFFTPDETGIEDLANNEIMLAPNPVNGSFQVALKKAPISSGNYQIINLEGKVIRQGNWPTGSQKIELQVDDFSNGIYLFRFTEGSERTFSKRFIKV
jgi:hypothetical protein